MNKTEEIDWSKVPMPGSYKPKKNYKEMLKGLWLVYLYFCLIFFGLIIASIIDKDRFYIKSVFAIQMWILFFTPCILYFASKIVTRMRKAKKQKIVSPITEATNVLTELIEKDNEAEVQLIDSGTRENLTNSINEVLDENISYIKKCISAEDKASLVEFFGENPKNNLPKVLYFIEKNNFNKKERLYLNKLVESLRV